MMEPTRADALAEAILSPDPVVKAELEKKRAAAAAAESRGRRLAWFSLAGGAIGAGAAYFVEIRLTQGVLWGCVAGTALGWLVARLGPR